MIVYRNADPRFPFLWENADQPAARWHGMGEGPVQYFADTPDGAWAEFVRHEGITQETELVNVRRSLWAIELPDDLPAETPALPVRILKGQSWPSTRTLPRRTCPRAVRFRRRRRGLDRCIRRTPPFGPADARPPPIALRSVTAFEKTQSSVAPSVYADSTHLPARP